MMLKRKTTWQNPGNDTWRSGLGQLEVRLEADVLSLHGKLGFEEAAFLTRGVRKFVLNRGVKRLILDLSALNDIDSAGVMALHFFKKKLSIKKVGLEFAGATGQVRDNMRLFSPSGLSDVVPPTFPGFFESIGHRVEVFVSSYLFGFLLLAANVFYWGLNDLFRPQARRKGEVVNQSVLIGVSAVPIVVFLSFVVGYVIALQSAGQLRSFGANIFVVDLVVISIMSQMGPLLTAILVAGRSGSAIAAEIATMKVTAELDSLKTMGLNPNRFVVVPKLYACMLTMPFLIILADIAGMAGGALAAWSYLDITPEVFINRMGSLVSNKHLYTGFIKSVVYSGIIVLTGSFYGFRVDRGAEGVGKSTTTAVVVAIALVILADSILGIVFY